MVLSITDITNEDVLSYQSSFKSPYFKSACLECNRQRDSYCKELTICGIGQKLEITEFEDDEPSKRGKGVALLGIFAVVSAGLVTLFFEIISRASNIDFDVDIGGGGGNGGGGGSGGNDPGCFASATPVWTPKGMIPISEIKSGDEVYSMNMETGKIEIRSVLETTSVVRSNLVKVSADKEFIICSDNHRFLAEGGSWKQIREIDGNVRSANGPMLVTVRKLGKKTLKVFNFEVDQVKNYFVGSSKLLVHNYKTQW